MSKDKPEPCHVTTNGGTLYQEATSMAAAESIAKMATDQAKKLGVTTTYVAVDKPYAFK